MDDAFSEVYKKFKLHFYREIFHHMQNSEMPLSAVETLCLEVIAALGQPTINEFASYINISSPNATYKVNSLIQKGYVEKIQSENDKREYHLKVTEQYYKYCNVSQEYLQTVEKRIQENCTKEEYEAFSRILKRISNELMPEVILPGA